MASHPPIRMFEMILTDMTSPSPSTASGQVLRTNMDALRKLKYTDQQEPRQNVSALDIPEELKNEGTVFLVGSPANHDPDRNRHAGQFGGNITFKQDVFFSMCWNTPPRTAVVMTFSQSACTFKKDGADKGLEWWTVLQPDPLRTFMLSPAWFQSYQPSQGYSENNDVLAADRENPDTMVAIFAPAAFARQVQWRDERLDVAATVLAWLSHSGKLVSFGAFTAELELDIATRARDSSP